jgi:hypothetical protein
MVGTASIESRADRHPSPYAEADVRAFAWIGVTLSVVLLLAIVVVMRRSAGGSPGREPRPRSR